MKFAKSMEERMVPEWSSKYIQYKQDAAKRSDVDRDEGKKQIKLVTSTFRVQSGVTYAKNAINRRTRTVSALFRNGPDPNYSKKDDSDEHPTWSPPRLDKNGPGSQASGTVTTPAADDQHALPSLQLPEPIQPLHPLIQLATEGSSPHGPRPASPILPENTDIPPPPPPPPPPEPTTPPQTTRRPLPVDRHSMRRSILGRSINFNPPPFVKRVSTFFGPSHHADDGNVDITDAQMRAAAEFHKWLLKELFRIEEFYKKREFEAVQRSEEIKEQLDILRDRWFKQHYRISYEGDASGVYDEHLQQEQSNQGASSSNGNGPEGTQQRSGWKDTFAYIGRGKQGNKNDPEIMGLSFGNRDMDDSRRDYERRKPINNPGHRLAKSKLKHAFIEYYHRLELLRSYVQLNRDAFRKITKKFDKVSGLRSSGKFMNEHINKGPFGGSDSKLDDLISDTEILFARFFSRSNRKEAALRLRTRENKSVYHSSLLRSGFYLGSSVVIGASSVWDALRILNDPVHSHDPFPGYDMRAKTGFILQIWGGVFLLLLQSLLFAINLRIWARNRINYAFIFEFANKHHLNHRQFLEIPSLLSLIFAVCFWFSIQNFWAGKLDMIHFPIVYVTITGLILLNPIKKFYFRARLYFITTVARVMFSGLHRVEFKDFWIGDMLCSQTYALGNIYLYFCLYAQAWHRPEQCNSSHSYTIGVFMCIPAFWRLLQCARRYYDSRQAFPHLANGAKYALTILQYLMLTVWRSDKQNGVLQGVYITIAAVSTFINIFWDVVMDWSLLNPYARWPFIRDTVGFKNPWVYYLAMFMDPPLRFSWVFYIIYANEIQHSALVSFLISTAEVLRRFGWSFFRMENEHCGNVGANRAYRDPRLPYQFANDNDPSAMVPSPIPDILGAYSDPLLVTPAQPTVDIEQGHAIGMRHRRSRTKRHGSSSPAMQALERLGRTMTNAHKKDYERRRGSDQDEGTVSSDDEEEEEEDADSEDFYQRTAGGREDLALSRTTSGVAR